MTDSSAVPSQEILFSHLVQIRDALWRNSSAGRASVMIGAGFSRQAESLAMAGSKLPLWSELRHWLAERLRLPADNHASVTEVAQIFEGRFGRAALDDAISDFIPDAAFGPGQAHRRLLALPWADVFTTNYDTLLERAAVDTIERRYEAILVAADLPQRAAPRIVKLHGTLPSHRPFIISADDYKNYPATHAPFVNLVRQSAMETILVLLGFSGQDPNFKEWMKWVQDELGDQAPPIYLCGVLELKPEEVAAMHSRRIIPLNLGDLFTKREFPQRDERHAAATAWLLEVLFAGKPTRAGEWAPDGELSVHVLRLVGPPARRFTVFDEGHQGQAVPPVNQLQKVGAIWAQQRQEYPGWIVAPNPPRWRVWHTTLRWRSYILKACGSLPLADQFRLLREMVWRIDLCLASVWTHEAQQITKVLEHCNPFPGVIEIPGADIQLAGVSDTELAEGWIELAFAVLRVAREDLDAEAHQKWLKRLESLLPVWSDLGPRLWSERAYWAQAQLDLDQLDQALKQWEANDRSLLGRAKLAAVKGELGRVQEAHEQASALLRELRSKLGALHSPLSLLSLEAWLINFIEMVKDKPWSRTTDARERLAELRRAECDPDEIITDLKTDLRDFEMPSDDRTEGPEFDPGFVEEAVESSRADDTGMLPAFRVLRLVEVAPCAWQSQNIAYLSREASAAAVWLQSTAPFWSLSVIVRTHDEKALAHFMDRATVVTLPDEQIDRIWQILQRLATQVLARIPEDFREASEDVACQMGVAALELLSRLAFRLPPPQLEQLVNLLVEWLCSPRAPKVWVFDKAIKVLIERVVFAVPKEQLSALAIRLLSVPVIADNGLGELKRGRWPEPAEPLLERTDWLTAPHALPPALLDRLLQHARSDDSQGRLRAIFRLLLLNERKWLSEAEREACATAIWSRLDPGSGEPLHLDFTAYGLSKLPGAERYDLHSRLKRADFKPLLLPDGKSMQLDVIDDLRAVLNDLRRRSNAFYKDPPSDVLSKDEAAQLLDKTTDWWMKNGALLKEIADGRRSMFFFEPSSARALAGSFATVVGECLLPVLRDDALAQDKAVAWRTTIEQVGFDAGRAMIGFLLVGKADSPTVAHQLSALLLGTTREQINDGSWLITSWNRAYRAGKLAEAPPVWLIDLLAYRVVWRTEPGLEISCHWVAHLIQECGVIISPHALSLLLQSLEVLLETTDFEKGWRDQAGQTAARKEAHRRMNLRASVTAVASALHAAAILRKEPPHPVLERWAKLASGSILPEIRRAWIERT